MFRIKPSNMAAFVAHEERELEGRVAGRLRDHFEHMRDRSDDALIQLVRQGRDRAMSYGIRSPYGISLYVGLMAELGTDFDVDGAYPWAVELLNDARMSGNDKVEFICERALDMSLTTPGAGGS